MTLRVRLTLECDVELPNVQHVTTEHFQDAIAECRKHGEVVDKSVEVKK